MTLTVKVSEHGVVIEQGKQKVVLTAAQAISLAQDIISLAQEIIRKCKIA